MRRRAVALVLAAASIASPQGWVKVLDVPDPGPLPKLSFKVVETIDVPVRDFDTPKAYVGLFGVAERRGTKKAKKPTPAKLRIVRLEVTDSARLWAKPLVGFRAFFVSPARVTGRYDLFIKPGNAERRVLAQYSPLGADGAREPGAVALDQAELLIAERFKDAKPAQPLRWVVPTAAHLDSRRTYVLIPKSHPAFPPDTPDTRPTRRSVAKTPLGEISAYRWPITANVPASDWWPDPAYRVVAQPVDAPNSFLFVSPDDDGLDLVVADGEKGARVVRLLPGGGRLTVPLPVYHGRLGAIVQGPKGDYFYFTWAEGADPRASLVRMNSSGRLLASATMENAATAYDIQRYRFASFSLLASERGVLLLMSRVYWSGHQGSTALHFDPSTLALIHNYGQNSGHSFGHRVLEDAGSFITADLGDNFPRGIVLNKIGDRRKAARTVFTYKTQHSPVDEPRRNGPDGQPLRAGLWSNDNSCYTELGSLVATSNGYFVLFSAERSTNNELAKSAHNESRNVGFVLARRDFERVEQKGQVVPPALLLSNGEDSAPFGFNNFGGTFSPQQNRGVVWLTAYKGKEKENAVAPRAVPLPGGRLLVLWERCTDRTFLETRGMVIDEFGLTLEPAFSLGTRVRLSETSPLLLRDGLLLWSSMDAKGTTIYAWRLSK